MADSVCVVIKIGSSSLCNVENGVLALSTIARLVEVVAKLREMNFDVVVVSSGAVASGCQKVEQKERPKDVARLQAMAAVGQVRLMRQYDDMFSSLKLVCAQVLLTYSNLSERGQYLNALNTLNELMRLQIVPIVNENDTVAVDELRFGDNDKLSAMVANMLSAQWLFLLTDVDALYTANPQKDPDAKKISVVDSIDDLDVSTDSDSSWGSGGMATKIQAARLAVACGVRAVITKASEPESILKILNGSEVGTQFVPKQNPVKGRKRWILGLKPNGSLFLDEGAVASVKKGTNLLAVGIRKVCGTFPARDAVRLCNKVGVEFARALVNYNSSEIKQILGAHSKSLPDKLGYIGSEAVADRGNTVLL